MNQIVYQNSIMELAKLLSSEKIYFIDFSLKTIAHNGNGKKITSLSSSKSFVFEFNFC